MSETVKTPSLAEVVSKRVRSLRERRGWSLSELARRAGIGVSTLSEIEAGQSAPRLDTLVALAHESERDWALNDGARLLKEMERAFYDEPLEPPKVPSLSERARALVLHAYREEQMTASAAAATLERTLYAVQVR